MKKKICIFIFIIVSFSFCFACDPDGVRGTYNDYEIQGEIFSQYTSIKLSNGKYELIEVRILNEDKIEELKSKGKYSVKDGGKIVFKESGGYSFEGEIVDKTLTLTYKYVIYILIK